jgi:hypothetical protein
MRTVNNNYAKCEICKYNTSNLLICKKEPIENINNPERK